MHVIIMLFIKWIIKIVAAIIIYIKIKRKTLKKKFSLKELWEAKLNIKYDMEIEYYKKFCGVPYKYKTLRKNTDFYNDSENTIYGNWKYHILKTIERLSLEELREYSRFLNQENRNRETQLISLRSLLIPYAICIIGGGLISPVFSILIDISSDISGEPIGAIFISKIIILIIFAFFLFIPIQIFKRLNNTNEKESVCQYFFQDIKEIVDEKIKFIETGSTNE